MSAPSAGAVKKKPDSPETKTVLVVEEQAAIRELIGRFVDGLAGFRVVGLAAGRQEMEALCAQLKPDMALVDWTPTLEDGDTVATAIRKRSSNTRVVIFSGHAEPHFVGEAIAAGVAGFVVKNATLVTLEKGLRAVAEGKQFFCPEMAGVLRELLQRSSAPSSDRSGLLTPREREVLREIAKGHFSKEIADRFDLTVFAVENIRRRIMQKTGLRSIAELTLYAYQLRLIGLPPSPHRETGRTVPPAPRD